MMLSAAHYRFIGNVAIEDRTALQAVLSSRV
jgi:hypothetical protein